MTHALQTPSQNSLPTDAATGLILPLSKSLGSLDLAKHRAVVAVELEVLAKKLDRFGWERDRNSPAHDRTLIDWMDALQDYPLDEIRAAWQRSRYASFCSTSPRYLPRQHSLTMHRKGCCEPCATELPDDVKDAGIIGGLANRTAEIRSVELPVDAGCRLDLVQKC